MRCVSCNVILSDYEASLKSTTTGQYIDLCSSCLSEVPEISVIGNDSLCLYEELEDGVD